MDDPVIDSLAIAAENAGDISEQVYARYFTTCPGSEALMSHIDHIVRGRMLEEVFRLVMIDGGYTSEQQYLDFEIKNHKLAYSVEPDMYRNLLGALRDTVREAVGHQWIDAHEAAWQHRLDSLLNEISRRT